VSSRETVFLVKQLKNYTRVICSSRTPGRSDNSVHFFIISAASTTNSQMGDYRYSTKKEIKGQKIINATK
jgi:hypothetical protein